MFLQDPFSNNYFAGQFGTEIYNNFFVFDLTGVSGPVTAATLQLYNPSEITEFGDGFLSANATETYTLFDVSTPTALLSARTDLSVFDDLNSGVSYGSVIMSAADNGQFVNIVLNDAGLAALNANLGGFFAIGGSLTSPGPLDVAYVYGFSGIFGSPDDGATGLQLTFGTPAVATPVPATALVGLVGVAGLGLGRLRRRV